jgi:teichuronic acid biosynthesis glycosyltransferase TuaC
MNVLCVTNFYPVPAAPARGVFIRRRVRAITRQGVSVTVVHPVPHVLPGAAMLVGRAAQFAGLPAHYDDDGVDVYQPRYLTWPGHLVAGIPHWFQHGPVKRLGLPRPDLIHAHFAAPSGLLARRLARDWGVPYVLTLHGYDTNFWPHHHAFNRRRFRSVCNDAARVFAVSGDLAGKAAAISGIRPEVLTAGVERSPDGLVPARAETRRRFGVADDAFVVLFVGNHIPTKGMVELHDAAASRPDIRFITAGIGPWRDRLDGLDNVTTLGQVQNEEVFALMHASDLMCLPSYTEGMPTVVLEAGAAGLPVVATRVGGIPELIGDDERGLLIPPGDSEVLVAAIDTVRADPAAAATRAGALREFVRRFDVDEYARRLAGIYSDVIDTGRRSSPGPG